MLKKNIFFSEKTKYKNPFKGQGLWCRRLDLWKKEALNEISQTLTKEELYIKEKNIDYAIIPKNFYFKTKLYDQTKKYDFCFLGALYQIGNHNYYKVIKKREWILTFIESFFNENSYLKFTDKKAINQARPIRAFDHTGEGESFCPKEKNINTKERGLFDENYYKIMCASKFCLCPGGDNNWSMRFYESLMCKSIPIIYNLKEKCRTQQECLLDYKYYLVNENKNEYHYNEEWAEHNYSLFIKYHTYDHIK